MEHQLTTWHLTVDELRNSQINILTFNIGRHRGCYICRDNTKSFQLYTLRFTCFTFSDQTNLSQLSQISAMSFNSFSCQLSWYWGWGHKKNIKYIHIFKFQTPMSCSKSVSLKTERFERNCTSRGKCTHDIWDNALPFHRHFVPLHQLWKPRPIRWNEHPNRWNNHPVR